MLADTLQHVHDLALRMGATSITPPGGLPHIGERYYGADGAGVGPYSCHG